MSEGNDEANNVTPKKQGKKKYRRVIDNNQNPCLKESQMSMECMSKNGYDRDKCYDYFMNYRSCLNFWSKVSRERRRKGIQPVVPSPEERKEIWDNFLKNRGK